MVREHTLYHFNPLKCSDICSMDQNVINFGKCSLKNVYSEIMGYSVTCVIRSGLLIRLFERITSLFS